MKGTGILIGFGVFWTAMTLLFDGLMVMPAVRQLEAAHFSETEGVVVSSQVTSHDSDDGQTYGVSIRYTFKVDGHEYLGSRYRYDTSSSSDSAWANAAVNQRPPGTKVHVYYNPRNPGDAVLATGIEGSDLFHAVFMTPFNGVMVGFWWFGLRRFRRRCSRPIAGGVKIRTEARQTRACMAVLSPLMVGLVAVIGLAFASIFIVAFSGNGFHPKLDTMYVTWTIILLGGFVAGLWQRLKIQSGKYDLAIDELAGALELPMTHGRKTRVRVPLGRVENVIVDPIIKPSSEGQSTTVYAPTLLIAGHREKLAEWYDEDAANDFVVWLRAKLPPKAARPGPLAGDFGNSQYKSR